MGCMKPLPMPIRLAAGLVATAVEEAQQLPRKIAEFPVTAVSQALQGAMRIQQTVTDLAIKGDRALGSLRPPPEEPSWARFDEDEEPLSVNGMSQRAIYQPRTPRVTPVRILPDLEDGADQDDPLDAVDFSKLAGQLTEETSDVPEQRTPPVPGDQAAQSVTAVADPGRADGGPEGLDEYETWSLAQLRARFRTLTRNELETLLVWETNHQNRPPYVTMLSNRIASISEQ
jgi:hypothetical protein